MHTLLKRICASSRITRCVLLTLGATSFGGAVLMAGVWLQATWATAVAGLYVLLAVWWIYTSLERDRKDNEL